MLADFTNNTGEPVFDGTLREALAIRLEESPFLKVMSDEEMRDGLELLGRSPDQHITNDIAREICIREGDKAMISGSIAGFGKTYAITLQATNCQTGDVLARGQVQPEDKDHVLKAVSGAGGDIRVKLGESLSSIQKLDRDYGQATTPSLAAFQAYAQGWEQRFHGGPLPAIRSFQRATELDPDFASAYEALGIFYFAMGAMGDPELMDGYFKKAFSLIDHVRSERERLLISDNYYWVTGQTDKMADIEQLFVRTYPRDYLAHVSLANSSLDTGDFENALRELQEALRLNHPTSPSIYGGLMGDYILLERFDEAKAVVRRASTQELEHPPIHQRLLILAYTEGDIQAAAKEVQWFTGKPEESQSLALQARNAYNSGQRRKAKELYSRARELLQRRNPASTAATIVVDDAVSDAVLGNCGAIHDAYKTAGLPSLNREPSPTAVLGLAFCGEAAQAQKIADKVSKQFTMDTLWNSVKAPSIQAAVELGRGQPAKAIELLRSAAPYERRYPYVMYLRGLAYLEAHEGVKAGVEFHKILDHKGAYWMFVSAGPFGPYYPLSYLGLARAAAMSGDTATAKKAYQDFLTLWKDADLDLAPLIQAREEYAALR